MQKAKEKTNVSRSNWTPANQEPSKEAIFKERMKLITNWFDMWTHRQRLDFFDHFLKRCEKKLLAGIETFLVETVPLERIDFTTIFPRHLSLFVFSFLDPKSLSRAATVSWHWKFLAEQDVLWIPKCVRHAWYLPFNPPSNQIGSWKRHYIACVETLNFKMFDGDESKWAEEQEENHKQTMKRQLFTKSQKMWKAINRNIKEKSLETRTAWVPSNKYPKDLMEMKNYSRQKNHSFTHEWDKISQWMETKDVLLTMNKLDFEVLLKSNGLKKEPKKLSEELKVENLMEKRITELKEFQSQCPRFWDPSKIIESSSIPISWDLTTEFFKRIEAKKIILICSELPAHELLVCSLLPDVVHLLYDFNSSTLDSLAYRINSLVKGKSRLHHIGFFPCNEKPGKLLLTKHSKGSTDEQDVIRLVKFFNNISGLLEDDGKVEIFQPVSCCDDCHWSSTSTLNKGGLHESFLEIYFNQERFLLWSNTRELMKEVCKNVSSSLDGYFRDAKERMISSVIGQIIYLALGFDTSEKLKSLAQALFKSFESFKDCPDDELLLNMSKYLQLCHQDMKNNDLKDDFQARFDASWINNVSSLSKATIQETSSSGDEGTKNKEVFETNMWKETTPVELSESRQILALDEFISSERFYNNCLKSLVHVFKKPIMFSMETDRAFISWQNAKLLFDDVTRIYKISCQLLDDLEVLRKKKSSKIYLGRLFIGFFKTFQSIMSAYLLAYPSILETYDKCKRQSHPFRAFLSRFESSFSSLMMSMPELYLKPLKQVEEYVQLLMAYRDVVPRDHADICNINASLRGLDQLVDDIAQNSKRISLQQQMMIIQERIKNCPQLLENGRNFIKEIEVAHLLPPLDTIVPELRVYRHAQDLQFYLFNDCLVCATKVGKSVPFQYRQREMQVFLCTSSLRYIRVADIIDSPYIRNGFKMWTPSQEWICSVKANSTKIDWISTLEQTIFFYLNAP